MAQTTYFNLEKPDPAKDVDEEFIQLQTTFDQLDNILKTFQDGISGKASVSHGHAITDIVDLSTQLAGKMAASQTFKLDDLTDVSGADGAATGYLLVKSALGWVPSSPIAALGTHGHTIAEITGLTTALTLKADADAVATALASKADASALAGKADQATTYTKTEVDGKTTIASEAEAKAFNDNTKLLTPLRGFQLATAYNRWETIQLTDLAGLSSVEITDLSDFAALRIDGRWLPGTLGAALRLQLSDDNGATWIAGTSYFHVTYGYAGGFGSSTTSNEPAMYVGFSNSDARPGDFLHTVQGFNKIERQQMFGHINYTNSVGTYGSYSIGNSTTNAAAKNALRFYSSSGVITSGLLHIEGIRG